jgi:hypothetical protein
LGVPDTAMDKLGAFTSVNSLLPLLVHGSPRKINEYLFEDKMKKA